MAYDNTNRGVLFEVEEKKSDRAPDFTGSINVDGVDYDLAGWSKEAKSGREYWSLSVKPKQERRQAEAPKSQRERAKAYQAGGDDFDAPF